MLEEGGRAGAFEATEAAGTCLSRVGGEGRGAGRIVEVEVVLVPVAAM